jgi:hypothetical protein
MLLSCDVLYIDTAISQFPSCFQDENTADITRVNLYIEASRFLFYTGLLSKLCELSKIVN